MKILIADDDESNRLLLARIVAVLGIPDQVVDGLEAVEAFELALGMGEPYDIVFLDIMMPKMDGLMALRAMRDLEGKNGVKGKDSGKIFMVSALGTEKNILEAFSKGECTDFLVKPVKKQTLYEKLADYGIWV